VPWRIVQKFALDERRIGVVLRTYQDVRIFFELTHTTTAYVVDIVLHSDTDVTIRSLPIFDQSRSQLRPIPHFKTLVEKALMPVAPSASTWNARDFVLPRQHLASALETIFAYANYYHMLSVVYKVVSVKPRNSADKVSIDFSPEPLSLRITNHADQYNFTMPAFKEVVMTVTGVEGTPAQAPPLNEAWRNSLTTFFATHVAAEPQNLFPMVAMTEMLMLPSTATRIFAQMIHCQQLGEPAFLLSLKHKSIVHSVDESRNKASVYFQVKMPQEPSKYTVHLELKYSIYPPKVEHFIPNGAAAPPLETNAAIQSLVARINQTLQQEQTMPVNVNPIQMPVDINPIPNLNQ